MEHDYPRLVREEMQDMSAFLATLEPEQWDGPTLCEGWRVRDVVGHICGGYSFPLHRMPLMLAKRGFSPPKMSHRLAIEFGTEHTPDELRRTFARLAETGQATGLAKLPKISERFADHLTHHQDIRRPLGSSRHIPPERLLAALDAVPKVGGFTKYKDNAAALHFVATDVDWTLGGPSLPEVKGPAEALILAMSGRSVVLSELAGPGVPVLAARIKAAA
jgi:uncharacterized protein (TIGR03083 family)